MDGEWHVVSNSKKSECSYLIKPYQAHILQRKLKIAKLAYTLNTKESHCIQHAGWHYDRVLRSQDPKPELNDESREYLYMPIDNKWGDHILFTRTRNDFKKLEKN